MAAGSVLCIAVAVMVGGGSLAAGGVESTITKSVPGLYTYDARTGALKTLERGGPERLDPRWSPDGRWLTYGSMRDGFVGVNVIPSTGGKARNVYTVLWSSDASHVAYGVREGLFVAASFDGDAKFVAAESDPLNWSLDGERLVFGSEREGCVGCAWHGLGVTDADGSGVRTLWRVPTGDYLEDAFWSPAGLQVAVVTHDSLFLVDPSRRGANEVDYAPDAYFKRWSPDGKSLLVANDSAVYTVDPNSGKARSLCPKRCDAPAFSPDGRRFAFFRSGSVFVEGVDGRGLKKVTEGAGFDWAPDSRHLVLAYWKPTGGNSSLAMADLATGRIERLTDGRHEDELDGVSANGSYLAFVRKRPLSLWVVGTTAGRPVQVMSLATGTLGPCPHVAWSPKASTLAISNAACAPS